MQIVGYCLAVLALSAAALSAEVRIIDGDTLDLNSERYRINGIDAPEAGQRCLDRRGKLWPCGEASTKALAQLVAGKRLRCTALERDRYGRMVATCRANGRDIGSEMVAMGMAWAFRKYSDAYVVEEFKAEQAGLGIWKGAAQPAWALRAEAWEVAGQLAPEGCPIKGNISSRGKIYHMPWSKSYRKTRIDEAKGERWFCDEADAIAAGWQAPRSR